MEVLSKALPSVALKIFSLNVMVRFEETDTPVASSDGVNTGEGARVSPVVNVILPTPIALSLSSSLPVIEA